MTVHAYHRTIERLVGAGYPEGRSVTLLRRAERIAWEDHRSEDVAIFLQGLGAVYGSYSTSFGDEVWAIARQGRVVTLFLRRSGEESTAEVFRVDRIVYAPEV